MEGLTLEQAKGMTHEQRRARYQELLKALPASIDAHQLQVTYRGLARNGHRDGPYEWQEKYHALGATIRQRAAICGNQTGKTRTIAAEVACHLVGWYPDWWVGKRFEKPIVACVAGQTNEETRNVPQAQLFGQMEDGERRPTGHGWVPKNNIGSFGFRQCGVPNVLDTVKVKHKSGGFSTCMLKSFEQGWLKFQGFEADIMWFDEEPEDFRIFTEAITRLAARNGIFMFSRTPLFGMSELMQHFMSDKKGVGYVTAGWDDAPHLTMEIREELAETYPEHERATRVQGVPMMGTGAVYPVPDEDLLVESFPIPSHFRRIVGIDFGIDHPGAGAWLAHDTDADILYLTDCYKMRGQTAAYHSQAILSRGKWIPVAWPHDGMIRDKGGGRAIKDQFLEHGCNMLPVSACYDDEKLGAQPREPATMEILERMRTGRFKVVDTPANREFLAEKRLLHRKDGLIVAQHDDIESAVRYASMMIRYAVSDIEGGTMARRPRFDTVAAAYDPLAAYSTRR